VYFGVFRAPFIERQWEEKLERNAWEVERRQRRRRQ
jgi:hypothetical protein